MRKMRLVFALILCLGFVQTTDIWAQTKQTSESKVVFDPLFWKDELKLTAGQYLEIRSINEEYYKEIMRLAYSGNDAAYLRAATTQLLQKRSDKIWNTFHSRQKRKWKEISSAYTNATLALSEKAKSDKNPG